MIWIWILFFLPLMDITAAQPSCGCGTAFKSYKYGVCAYISDTQMNYCGAVEACAKNNGRLVSNYDNLVTILLAESNTANIAKSYYIGISLLNNTDQTKTKLIWNDKPLEYFGGSTDFINKPCGVFTVLSGGKKVIGGSDCSAFYNYICEEVVQRKIKQYNLPPTTSIDKTDCENIKCPSSYTVEKVNKETDCFALCLDEINCRSFGFNEKAQCEISSLPTVLVPSKYWNIYLNKAVSKKNKKWTTFVRRVSNSVDFGVGWEKYKSGFGDTNGNFWLGLENMFQLTSKNSVARIYFTDWDNTVYYSEYSNFIIGSEASNYKISYSGLTGTLCDGFINGAQFSTIDADHDTYGSNCASLFAKAGWWHKECHAGILTGKYYTKDEVDKSAIHFATGVHFMCFNTRGFYYSMKHVEGKILTDDADFQEV